MNPYTDDLQAALERAEAAEKKLEEMEDKADIRAEHAPVAGSDSRPWWFRVAPWRSPALSILYFLLGLAVNAAMIYGCCLLIQMLRRGHGNGETLTVIYVISALLSVFTVIAAVVGVVMGLVGSHSPDIQPDAVKDGIPVGYTGRRVRCAVAIFGWCMCPAAIYIMAFKHVFDRVKNDLLPGFFSKDKE